MREKNTQPQRNNPMHAITLKEVMEALRERYTWEELAKEVKINCFSKNPSIKSSLNFLRKTDWARAKVERLYLKKIKKK